MPGSSDDNTAKRAVPIPTPRPVPGQMWPSTARSATSRGSSGVVPAERIGHAHQWLSRAAPQQTAPVPAPPQPEIPTAPAGDVVSTEPRWPPRVRDNSSGFYTTPAGGLPVTEHSSPFAATALDHTSRPGRFGTSPGNEPRTSPGFGGRPPDSEPHVSDAMAGLPISRPRTNSSAHGVALTPPGAHSSHAGADAALLALPNIPQHASAIAPSDPDAALAFEALFNGEPVTDQEAAHLAARMWRHTVAAGQPIVTQGAAADFAFVVATGLGRIEWSGPTDNVALNPLRSGDLVGHAMLCGAGQHSDTATAASDMTVFVLDRQEFDKLGASAPRLANRLLGVALMQASRRMRVQAERMVQYAKLELGESGLHAAPPVEAPPSRFGRLLARLAGSKENE